MTISGLNTAPKARKGGLALIAEPAYKPPHGVLIVGMPSLQSQAYASPQSKEGHVNCKDQGEFGALMKRYFHNVFMFSMNDEVVHTGYSAMSHYNLALCCSKNDPD